MPYGRQSTAGVAGGCPFFVASASAARRASTVFWKSGFITMGVAGGGAIFGSAPRPPPIGTQAPLMFRPAVDCARVTGVSAAAPNSVTPSRRSTMRVLTASAPPARLGVRIRGARADAGRAAVSEHPPVRQRDSRQQTARLAIPQRAHDRGDLVALLHAVELPSAALEDARTSKLDAPVPMAL